MITLAHISRIQKLNRVLVNYDRKLVNDGRLLAVVHAPAQGKASVTRYPDMEAVISSLAGLDERITQITRVCG